MNLSDQHRQPTQAFQWNTNGSFSQQKPSRQNTSSFRDDQSHQGLANHSFSQQHSQYGIQEMNQKTQYIGYQLPNILCTRGRGPNQHNQPLCLVCTDKDCLNSNEFMLCAICSQYDHQDHEQIPLKVMIQDVLYSLSNQEFLPKSLENKLMSNKVEALNLLADLRQTLTERLDQIEQEIIYVYEVLGQCQVKMSSTGQKQDIIERIDNLMGCTTEDQLREEFQAIMNSTPAIIEGNYLCDISASNTTTDIDSRHESLIAILNGLSKGSDQVFTQYAKQLNSLSQTCGNILHSTVVNSIDNHSIVIENQDLQRNTIYDPSYKSNSLITNNGSSAKFQGGMKSSQNNSIERSRIERNGSFDKVSLNKSQISQTSNKSLIEISKVPAQRFEYSKTLKDPNIQVQNRILINGPYEQSDQKFHYRAQLLQPELESVTPSIKQWSFKIARQLPHWIGFGVCHINEMKARKFKFANEEFSFSHQEGAKRQSNHGCYLLTTHGWSFAHQRAPIKTNIKFKRNDVITCRFDPFKKLIIYYQNSNFQSPINIIEFNTICWNKIYPCVVFWYPDDSVELL